MNERTSTACLPKQLAAERYERLRSEALGISTATQGSGGLCLLMRHGMTAWMGTSARCATVAAHQPRATSLLPPSHSDLVTVLAQMAVAAVLQEGSP